MEEKTKQNACWAIFQITHSIIIIIIIIIIQQIKIRDNQPTYLNELNDVRQSEFFPAYPTGQGIASYKLRVGWKKQTK